MISPVEMPKKCKREDRCRTYSECNDSAKGVYISGWSSSQLVARWSLTNAACVRFSAGDLIPATKMRRVFHLLPVCHPPSLGGDIKPLT